jgi:acyl-[acyl-carrier-protein]-phospholipid O-acyltransferase / long-chain-fatty-acid--[acyl-carrier-protein] ligase
MNHGARTAQTSGSYSKLFADSGFQAFLWTQFLGAFNDNVYKMIVSVLAVRIAADAAVGSRYLALAGAVFVIPFLLFAGPAGQLADRFSKSRVLQTTKAFEIVVMLIGIAALLANEVGLLLIVLFLLAVQANFFSPAKYGILPEILPESQLARANGLLELSTFAAIVLGTSAGTLIYEHWSSEPLKMGLLLLGIAVLGSVTSLRITPAPASGSREPFHWNPFHEIAAGAHVLSKNRSMWLSVIGISWFWFVGALFQMAMLLFGRETLHVSEFQVALLVTGLAIGIGTGSIVAGRISGDHIDLGLVPLGSAFMGVFSIALGSTSSYAWAMVWLVALGFASGLFIVPLNAWLQDRAGHKEKGRILATNNFANMVGVIAASGMLWLFHDVFGWSASLVILGLGVVMLPATIYVITLLPGFSLRILLAVLLRLAFRIRIVGAEHMPRRGGALLIANHVSFADAVLVGYTTGRLIRFLMWQRYFEMKFANPLCRALEAIPLPIESPRQALRALHRARTELRNGELVCIFPEGSITRTGQVQAFYSGFERIVDGTDAPVIPIYLEGLWGHPLSYRGGRLFRNWWPLRREVIIAIGEPVPASTSPSELRRRVIELGSEAAQVRKTRDSTLVHRFVRAARCNWSALALADSTGRRLTFGETLTGALLIRRWIDSQLSDQQYVGVLLPASTAASVVNVGIALSGKTAVNLNFTAGEESMRAAMRKCDISGILTSRPFLEKIKMEPSAGMVLVEDLLGSFTRIQKLLAFMEARFIPMRRLAGGVRPDDVAAVIFSSGSTGEPKGIQLTHWNLVANIDSVAQVFDVGRADRMLGALPLFHSFGYTYTLWFPLLNNFGSVFHSNPTDGKTIGELAATYRATFLLSTPTFCLAYIRHCTREQFATLRYVLVGAEKLRQSVEESFREKFGVSPLEGYGMTEMGPVVAVNTPSVNRADSVGQPLPGAAYRIVDPETLADTEDGSPGLLLVKGPSLMKGYLSDPLKTSAAMHKGYYNTGDIVRIDEDGFLFIVDRIARLSKIGGEMVPHIKVEQALAPLLDGAGCVVVGIPDAQRGERLAVLHTRADLAPSEMIAHLTSAGIPNLWIPKRENFYSVETIPYLGTGKTDLRRARAIALEHAAGRNGHVVE